MGIQSLNTARTLQPGSNNMDDNNAKNVSRLVGVALLIFAASLVFALFSIYRSPLESTARETLVISTGAWPPYTGEALASNGAVTAIVSQVFQQAGISPEYLFTRWDDALDRALNNESNNGVRASFPWFYTHEREKNFYFSESIAELQHSFYVNPHNTEGLPKNESDLSKFYLLRIGGYDVPDSIRKIIKGTYKKDGKEIIKADTTSALTYLANTEDPIFVLEASRVVNELLVREKDLYEANITEAFTQDIPVYLLASKRNPYNFKFIRQFNSALADLGRANSVQIFNNTLAAIARQKKIELVPADSSGFLLAFEDENKSKTLVLATGTKAIVLRWPQEFIRPQTSINTDRISLVPVKIDGGPHDGSTFFVDGRSIHIP